MSKQDFAANLRLLAGYDRSISAICAGAGVNRTQFHRYFNGTAEPTFNSLRRICDYFVVEEYEILLPHHEFRQLIRLRPPQIKDTSDPFWETQRRLFSGDPVDRLAMGYYHMIFRPDRETGIIYRAILRMDRAGPGIVVKLVERYPRPAPRALATATHGV